MNKIKAFTTKFCVMWINRQLMRDVGFYQAYKANIAMSVYDIFDRKQLLTPENRHEVLKICNEGADRFLSFWRSQP